MRTTRVSLVLALLLCWAAITASMARAQGIDPTSRTTSAAPLTPNDIVDRMSQAERAVLVLLKTYRPLMEVYLQNLAPDEVRGWVPTDDNYYLGQLKVDETPSLRPIGQRAPKTRGFLLHTRSSQPSVGDAFAAMVAPDWQALERKRYDFKYVRREFLGESRCFVFDVRPREGKEGFVGRIWIEDRDYNLVRFNGASHSMDEELSGLLRRTLSFHMDSWRVNVAPGVWVPSYVYSEETDLAGTHNLPVVHEEHGGFAGVQQFGDLGLVALLLLGRESGIAGHPNPVGLVAEHHIDGIVPSLRVAVEISDLLACPGCPRSHAP